MEPRVQANGALTTCSATEQPRNRLMQNPRTESHADEALNIGMINLGTPYYKSTKARLCDLDEDRLCLEEILKRIERFSFPTAS
jgi:hypothetical protein